MSEENDDGLFFNDVFSVMAEMTLFGLLIDRDIYSEHRLGEAHTFWTFLFFFSIVSTVNILVACWLWMRRCSKVGKDYWWTMVRRVSLKSSISLSIEFSGVILVEVLFPTLDMYPVERQIALLCVNFVIIGQKSLLLSTTKSKSA